MCIGLEEIKHFYMKNYDSSDECHLWPSDISGVETSTGYFGIPLSAWTFKDIAKQIHNHSIHSQHFTWGMTRTTLEPCVYFHNVTYVSQNSYEEQATWYISGGYTKNKNAGCLIQIPNMIERNQYFQKHITSNLSTTNRRFPWLTSMMCWLTFWNSLILRGRNVNILGLEVLDVFKA